MKILAIIPARAGSKGIKNKNMYFCADKFLISWTVDAIKKTDLDYIISTDSGLIKMVYHNVHKRPDNLCQDDTTMIDVVKYLSDKFSQYDAFMILQPTSPLRTTEDIDNAIKLFKESGVTSLYSGYYMGIKHKSKVYDKHTSEKYFQRNGAIFIAKRELIEQGKLWDETVIEYEMPLSRSIDIDNMDDMYIAEALLEKRLKEGKTP